MKKHIEISKGFEKNHQVDEDAFLKLSDDSRFRVICELSEIMLSIQHENGVLPKDDNFILRK